MTFISFLCLFILCIFTLWLIAIYYLDGPELSEFDISIEDTANDVFDSHPEDTENNKKMLNKLAQARQQAVKSPFKAIKIARAFADELSIELVSDSQFLAIDTPEVKGEWVIAPGANPKNRVIFFHGGAFMLGSPLGHRKFTDKLSRLANAAVLAVSYRRLPGFSRSAGIIDAQQAYLWALENGPNGPEKLDFLTVAGDSAGGNLTHMIGSWSAQHAPRKADCLLSFSPSLDQTFCSPTLQSNLSSDKVLGDGLSLITKLPKPLRLWLLFISMRMNPSNPLASPVFSDLTSLPPTLIHVSSSEMLLGESIRYTNKARAQGSDVRLQVWKDQIHDWHMFNMGFGSAEVAWNEVAKFITEQKTRLNLIPDSLESSSSNDNEKQLQKNVI